MRAVLLGLVCGALAGAVAAPLGAALALGIAATADISGLGLLFSLGGVFGALPGVALAGLVVGAAVGALVGWLAARVRG